MHGCMNIQLSNALPNSLRFVRFSSARRSQNLPLMVFCPLYNLKEWDGCECVVYSREMRSKHFLSSRLGLTWQVRRLSLAGDLLGCSEGEEYNHLHGMTKGLSASFVYVSFVCVG